MQTSATSNIKKKREDETPLSFHLPTKTFQSIFPRYEEK